MHVHSTTDQHGTKTGIVVTRPRPERQADNDSAASARLDLAPDIAFLVYHGLPFAALWRATERSRELRVSARRCLVDAGTISEETLAAIICSRFALERATDILPDASVDVEQAVRFGWFRARKMDGQAVLVVSTMGAATPAFFKSTRIERPIVVATSEAFSRLLRQGQRAAIVQNASASVASSMSAREGMSRAQKLICAALSICLVSGLLVDIEFIVLPTVLLGWIFLAATVIQLAACYEPANLEKKVRRLQDSELPHYSVLVPLHDEAAIASQLVKSLERLDYPKEKLQVLFLVEEDDSKTRQAIGATGLKPHMSMLIVPRGHPRTKPRALNVGMQFATGELIVVYDAEDRPDAQQLRLAANTFARSSAAVACLQARLVIDNANDSMLTRLFALEYAALFDVVKAGWANLSLPIPLGGTSNHFKASILRKIGLWDAWNVTEDADIGYRLARHGYEVADLNSDTLEEAPADLRSWLAQRTRWTKGWMQTVITHSRQPLQALREMGLANFVSAVVTSMGVLIGALTSPLFVALAVLRFRSDDFLAGETYLQSIADGTMTIVCAFGLASMIMPILLGIQRRCLRDLLASCLLLPLYHLLMFVAGWRAVCELVWAPYRWNKTAHGLARTSRSSGHDEMSDTHPINSRSTTAEMTSTPRELALRAGI